MDAFLCVCVCVCVFACVVGKNSKTLDLSPMADNAITRGAGLELQILKGTHFKANLKGQLRASRPLHVKE